MNIEQKLKQVIGELNFTVIVLQTQLEAANKRIAELEKEKDESPKAKAKA